MTPQPSGTALRGRTTGRASLPRAKPPRSIKGRAQAAAAQRPRVPSGFAAPISPRDHSRPVHAPPGAPPQRHRTPSTDRAPCDPCAPPQHRSAAAGAAPSCRHAPGGARADTPNPPLSPAAQGATRERTANPDPAVRPPAPPALTGVSSRSPSIPAAPPPAGSTGAAASPAWHPRAGGAGVPHNRIVPHDGERARQRAPPRGRGHPPPQRQGPPLRSSREIGVFEKGGLCFFRSAKRRCECRPSQRRGVFGTSPLRALPLIASSGNGDVTQVCVCPWGEKHHHSSPCGKASWAGAF